MMMSEKKFGLIYHTKEALKFNTLHLVFKYTYLWSPVLMFMWFVLPTFWIFPVIGFISLVSWLVSVKMKSLRNINFYAAKQFKTEYSDEMATMFR